MILWKFMIRMICNEKHGCNTYFAMGFYVRKYSNLCGFTISFRKYINGYITYGFVRTKNGVYSIYAAKIFNGVI